MIDRDHETGAPITAGDKVIRLTRTIWRPRKAIAAAAGVTTVTIDNWIKAGGRARAKAERGEHLTHSDRRYAAFLDGWERAEGEAIAQRLAGIQRIGQGGYTRTRTTTRTRQVVVKGEVRTLTETTTVEETADGEWTALAWQLERGLPAEFSIGTMRLHIEGHIGTDGPSRDERADALADGLKIFLEGAKAGSDAAHAIEAASVEVDGNGHG